jgi:hypothetical protein
VKIQNWAALADPAWVRFEPPIASPKGAFSLTVFLWWLGVEQAYLGPDVGTIADGAALEIVQVA